jgi:hypothetical protein
MYFNYNFDCPYCNYRSEYPMSPPPSFGGPQGQYSENRQYNKPPSGPPNMGGMHGNQQASPPSGPPPNATPSKNQGSVKSYSGVSTKAIESGAIFPCKYQYVYIWLTNGTSFWAWLTYVGRKSVSGYRWNGRRWVYFGTDLRRIDSFVCR